ncbi:hypothetical protein [Agromyces sp. NPDC058126]|uniref:hypothetical protein n=1 Tax=Agromyces sp. NPDC058126 TaxID=3346350 RepID=UPI0036DAEDED
MADERDCGLFGSGCWAEDVVNGAIGEFVKSLGDGIVNALGWLNSMWLEMPSPTLEGDPAIAAMTGALSWYTFAIAAAGILFALGRMAIQRDFAAGASGLKALINLVVVCGAYMAGVAGLTRAGDAFAPWIMQKATGQELSLTGVLTVTMLIGPGPGPGVIIGLLGFLGAMANMVFMVFRGALLTLFMVFLPSLAAGSSTETGADAFRKANGWLLALVLFKPVAAVVYATGMLLMKNPGTVKSLDDHGQLMLQAVIGMTVLLVAALSLPALVKFLVPVAGAATAGAFSGGAALAGSVAAGSAVVSLGASAAAGSAAKAASAGAGSGGGSSALAAGSSAAAGGGASAANGGPSGSSTAASSGAGSSSTGGGSPEAGSTRTGMAEPSGSSAPGDAGHAENGASGSRVGDVARAFGDLGRVGASGSPMDEMSEGSTA